MPAGPWNAAPFTTIAPTVTAVLFGFERVNVLAMLVPHCIWPKSAVAPAGSCVPPKLRRASGIADAVIVTPIVFTVMTAL